MKRHVWLLATALLGCDEEPPQPTEEEAVAVAQMAQQEAALNASETGDRSLDDCLARLRRETPSSAQWTIGVLGYDDFMLDTCRAQMAVNDEDAAPCREIEARLVQSACLARVAVRTRAPDLCPRQARGADPLCMALASRQIGLCQASPLLEREACVELLGDARHGCRTSIAPDLCNGIVARHRDALAGQSEGPSGSQSDGQLETDEGASGEIEEPSLNATFTRVIGQDPPNVIGERELPLNSFARGARIVEESGRLLLELADPLGLSAGSHTSRPQIAIRIPLPTDQQTGLLPTDPQTDHHPIGAWTMEIEAVGASLEAHHTDLGTLRATSGEVHIEGFERRLGAQVEGTFRVECPQAPGSIRIEGTFRTFLREI